MLREIQKMAFAVLIFSEGFAEDNINNKQSLVPRPSLLFSQQLKKKSYVVDQISVFFCEEIRCKTKVPQCIPLFSNHHSFQLPNNRFLWLELRPIKKLIGSQ